MWLAPQQGRAPPAGSGKNTLSSKLKERDPCPSRCRKMTGGVTPRVERMGRSPAAGCGAAATSKPWGMRRVETQMVAPRHLQKHSPDALPPAVPPAWTQPGSSKERVGGCRRRSRVPAGPVCLSLLVGGGGNGVGYEEQNLVRGSDFIMLLRLSVLAHYHSDFRICLAAAVSHPGSIPGVPSLATAVPSQLDR